MILKHLNMSIERTIIALTRSKNVSFITSIEGRYFFVLLL